MRSARTGIFRLIAIVALCFCALAQNSGSFTGAVRDSAGLVIPGATVTVTEQATGYRQTARTSSEGIFVFPTLPPGTYTIAVEAKGFKKSESKGVILPVASKVSVGDVVMEVGTLTDTVTVEANAGTIQIQAESGERS